MVLSLMTACSYGNGVRTVEGKAFPAEAVETIQKGMTANQARERLGEPFEVRPIKGGESWRYYCRFQQEATKRFLGVVIARAPGQSWKREAILVLRGGVVESVVTQRSQSSQGERAITPSGTPPPSPEGRKGIPE
jgi:outer membrane protein assembly factor BamE (lipoprotein component of BamABCDE complex)